MKIKVIACIAMLAAGSASVAQTRVNVGHLAPFADDVANTAVSVEVGGTEVLTGVVFNQFSGYLELTGPGTAPGDTLVEVFAPPGAPPAAISETFDLPADTSLTVSAIGDGTNQPLEFLPLVDDLSAPSPGNAKLRVVHAAPFAADLADTAVSVRLQDGTVVNGLNSVEYKQDSGFFELPAAEYDLVIATPDGSTALIDPVPVTLNDGDIVTAFAVGDGVNQPLGVTAVFGDGSFAPLSLAISGFEPVPALSGIGLLVLLVLVGVVALRRFAVA